MEIVFVVYKITKARALDLLKFDFKFLLRHLTTISEAKTGLCNTNRVR